MTPAQPSDPRATPLRLVERPLTSAELAAAAGLLGSNAQPDALAKLALPAGLLPDAVVQVTNEGLLWRGALLRTEELATPEAVAAWAESAWQLDERGAVPEGPMWRWIRVVRSGVGLAVWGPRELWGGPDLAADVSTSPAVIVDLCRRWWAGEELGPPCVIMVDGHDVAFLDGTDEAWTLTTAPTETSVSSRCASGEVAELVTELATELAATSWTVTQPQRRRARWVAQLELTGWCASFEVTSDGGALCVGSRRGGEGTDDVPDLPAGWTAVSANAGAVTAVSERGLWATLQRSS